MSGRLDRKPAVEDVYPLTPVQEGILFHALESPGSDAYVTQLALLLEKPDVPALTRAFQRLVDRYAVLRTAFAWQKTERPLQVVARQAALPVSYLDWSKANGNGNGNEPSLDERVEELLRADRCTGFELSRAPLTRLAIADVGGGDHCLVWSFHHILFDGWSVPILLSELLSFYSGERESREVSLPEVRPYKDYVAWLATRDAARAERAWRRRLDGFAGVTTLGTRDGRSGAEEPEGRASIRLDAATTTRLRDRAKQHRVTFNTLVEGAWAIVLGRLGRSGDVLFGTTVSGRNPELAGIESMVGLLINTLPVRVRFEPDDSLGAWLRRIQAEAARMRDHEHTPLVDIQKWCGFAPGEPPFDSLVVFENYPIDSALATKGLSLQVRKAWVVDGSSYPLTVVVAPGAELSVRVSFQRERYAEATVRRALGYLESVLREMALKPDPRLRELWLVSSAASERLTAWNRTDKDFGPFEPVHQRVGERARLTPEAVAIRFEGRELRYRELWELAGALARDLRDLGIGPDSVVGILCDRSFEMLVAVLGVLRAGAAYLPLDPDYPKERIDLMLADSGVGVVLVGPARGVDADPNPKVTARRLDLEALELRIQGDDASAADERTPSAEHLAYVLFTSGSTGRPKGVGMRQGALANLVAWQVETSPLGPGSRTLQFASLSFDVSFQEIFATWVAGGTLVLVDEVTRREPSALLDLLTHEGIERIFLPFVALHQLAEAARATSTYPESLREVVTAGEALETTPGIEAFFRELPGAKLFNQYGPTEAHVVTEQALEGPSDAWPRRPPIGRPIANARIYVLDEELEQVPIGAPGELAIGGACLARGYLERPELTAERFVPDPFSPREGARLYRTGDLARFLDDGTVEFLGRADQQIKVRGYRVEPGEIEAVLREHPRVRDVVVDVRGTSSLEARLVAYVVGRGEVDRTALLEHARRRLPHYMVPSSLVVLEALPLTPSGKLDRRALPAPGSGGEGSRRTLPRDPVEEALLEIWKEVLGVASAFVEDDFFEAGGHSLSATRLVSRVRRALGVDLPLRALFEAPTIALLAERVRAAIGTGPEPPRPEARIEAFPRATDRVPLSYAQRRLWFFEELEPEASAYNLSGAARLRGPLDLSVLTRSFRRILERHEVLRTRFTSVGGAPEGRVAQAVDFELPVIDLTGLPETLREETARRRARELGLVRFTLSRPPLMRAAAFRLSEADHVLALSMHHIVSDGWSIGLLFHELHAGYEREQGEGRASATADRANDVALPPPPIQYADYAAWQQSYLDSGELDRQLDYWRRRLSGIPASLDLPLDRPRPTRAGFRGASATLELPTPTAEAVRRLNRREGVTPFMTYLAVLHALLHRMTGAPAIAVGTPIANRQRPELEALIGFFVNVLVMRGDLQGNPSFSELLHRTRDSALAAYAHQDLPFDRLVEELAPDRRVDRHPIFQVAFALVPGATTEAALGGVSLESFELPVATTRFDLELYVLDKPRGAKLTAVYNRDLFDASTVESFLTHYRNLLESALASPGRRLSELTLLGAEERRAVLAMGRGVEANPPAATVTALFERVASRFPGETAVRFRGESMSYGELDRRASRIARLLVSRGVGPETLVGIALPRSFELVAALVGILKAGGAYLPLDPAYPEERLSFMLEDAQSSIVVTESAIVEKLPGINAALLCLDELIQVDEELELERDVTLPVTTSSSSRIYVTYTSGSTGVPKGVEVLHRGVTRLLFGGDYASLGRSERILQLAPLAFDASTFEIWGALLHGGTVVLYDGVVPLPRTLSRVIREEGVTTLFLTTSLFNAILDEEPFALRGLRQLLTGGEAASLPHFRSVLERFPETRLVHCYGPTESTTFTTCHGVLEVPADAETVPLGRSIADTATYVLDAHLNPVPLGAPGELFIGGAGLARGYLRRPELTAERFLPDPFGAEPGARIYRTGDRARFTSDGNLEFLGRIDEQIKVRGFRVEPGEIVSVLLTYPGVREAVVIARDNGLVAYVVATASGASASSASDLRRYLTGKLPEYMVPTAWVFLDALPLTEHGKLDRRRLPHPNEVATESDDFVAPRSALERKLASIWSEVLGRDGVGVHDDFFELGGHSLLATQLVSRIRSRLGVELPLRALFEKPTIASLAEDVETRATSAASPIGPVSRETPLPLSFAQQRLWFLDQLEPGTPAYNLAGALRLRGALDVAALVASLTELVARHEPLRTTFATVGGRAIQRILDAGPFALPEIDLGGLDAFEREEEARRLSTSFARAPFDLERGPLFRALLVTLDRDDHVFGLGMHHIVSDGWSIGVLFRELSEMYARHLRGSGTVHELPPLPIQYADFAAWQREVFSGPYLQEQLRYWREELRELPALELPTDHPRPMARTYEGGRADAFLPADLSLALASLCRDEGVTLFMALLGAFAALLHRYTGSEDVALGSPIANRHRGELEGLIGFFVNTQVLRVRLDGDPTFREILSRARDVSLGAFTHQDLPFEKLVDELAPERHLNQTPLFQVIFTVQSAPPAMPTLEGLDVLPFSVDHGTTRFDLELHVWDRPTGTQLYLFYNRALFEPSSAARILRHFTRLLESASASPERRLSALSVLSEAERRRVVSDWNETRVSYPKEATIADELEKRVQERPEAVALVGGEERLTYAELNARANAVALELQRRGVGANVLVGLHGERSVGLLVGLVAIVKAGGGYVPLEPSYPSERLRYLARDSGVSLVLETGESGLDWGVPRVGLPSDESGVEENPKRASRGEDVAYVTYTSGSTGAPKGVEVPHRAVMRLVFGGGYVSLGREERILQLAPVAFDASTFEIWGALLHGGRLVIYPERVPTASELEETIAREGITTMWLTASLFNALVDERAVSLSGLRQLITGGEALSVRHVSKALEALQETTLWNGYGPTEGTTFTCCHRIPESLGMEADCDTIPIGRPIGNTRVYVLDAGMEPTAVGVPGELYIGGDGLARGYRGSPELTAAKFVPDPFGEEPGGRLYRTGDRVRYREDGRLEFLGRRDHQVKLRGFRIELGEIETDLRAHHAVRDASVLVREDEPGSRRLVAYVVPEEPEAPELASDLRDHLTDRLPGYMVPASFVRLDSLPLTSNGKVDRASLPAPETPTDAGRTSAGEAPRTDAERVLARIWSEVLHLPEVGVHDNFFELGGDSILSIQIVSRARGEGIHFTPRQLFQHQTVAELAAAATGSRARSFAEAPLTGPASLTPIQHWFFDLDLEEAHHFNQALLLEWMDENPDPVLLARSFSLLVQQHDALRSRFIRSGESWQQRYEPVVPESDATFAIFDLGAVPAALRTGVLESTAAAIQASLDFENGPVVRGALFLVPGSHARLLLCAHHLVVDGVSWRILLEDLETAYRGLRDGGRVELPPRTSSVARWAERLAAKARSEETLTELPFWLEVLRSAPPIPVDLESDPGIVASSDAVHFSLDVEATRTLLTEVPTFYKADINEVLLTALARAITAWTGEERAVVDLEGHGREDLFDDVSLDRTVGWFTTIYPVALTGRRNASVAESLKTVKESLRRVPGKGLGFGLLRYLSEDESIRGELAGAPRPSIAFNYLGQFDQTYSDASFFRPARESAGPMMSPRGKRPHLLSVNGAVKSERLWMSFSFSRSQLRRDTVESLSREYVATLESLLAGCRAQEPVAYSASDFTLVKTDPRKLESFLSRKRSKSKTS